MVTKRKASASATKKIAQPEELKHNDEPEQEESESESGSDSSQDEEEDESSKRESIRKLLEPFGKDQIIEMIKQAALNDPSLLTRVTQVANSDPTHRKIFVHGLSWDATTEQVLDAFMTYGEIEECKLITDKITGKTKGYAFVLFKTRSAAQKALQQPQKKIGNRTTCCQLAAVGPTAAAPDAGSRKIYVGNVGPNVTAENLHAFFSKFGEIEEGPSGFDPATRKPRGFAIFVYKTPEGAKKALEEPIKVFDGCQLHCKKFVENLNNNSSSSNNTSTVNQAGQQQSDTMSYGIGMNPGMLGAGGMFMGQSPGIGLTANPLLGLATPALGASVAGNYGMISNYGSHVALPGMGAYQTAQMVPPSAAETQPGFGSVGASFPSYSGR